MLELLKTSAVTLAVFLAIDMVWLAFIARQLYAKMLHGLMAPQVNWVAAIIFYALYAVGLSWLIIIPGSHKSFGETIIRGGVFGLLAYATYDLTNLATLKNWPWQISIIDMIWGTLLTASVTAVVWFILYR